MKIYTRTGDDGSTGLWGGKRVSKDSLRVHAYGSIDECNAALGLVRTTGVGAELDAMLAQIQNELFVVGADLASPDAKTKIDRVDQQSVQALEQHIDSLEAQLAPLQQFILPGGTQAAAQLHLARTICRRAERWTVSLAHEEAINEHVLQYINRLSDLLFVMARAANAQAHVQDVPWNTPRK